MKKFRNDCVTKYSLGLFHISSTTELCAIIRKLWNSLQNKLNNIYKRDAHFEDYYCDRFIGIKLIRIMLCH